MRAFLSFLPALACGGMMFVCFRSMFGHKGEAESSSTESEIQELRAEVARLRKERESADG